MVRAVLVGRATQVVGNSLPGFDRRNKERDGLNGRVRARGRARGRESLGDFEYSVERAKMLRNLWYGMVEQHQISLSTVRLIGGYTPLRPIFFSGCKTRVLYKTQ